MDIVNQSIITVTDLAAVDGKISELERLIRQKNDEAQSNLSKSTVFEDEQTTVQVGRIIDSIVSLDVDDVDVSITRLSELGEEHQGLQIVDDLSGLFRSKQMIHKNQEYLASAVAIEDRLDSVNAGDINEYESIAASITQLRDPEASIDLVNEVKSTLYGKLDEKIAVYKDQLITQLKEILKKINWLGHEFNSECLTSEILVQLNSLIAVLVSLQTINHRPIYPDTWWALDVLLEPYVSRFNFHFNTAKETNKLSKPEWAFSFVEEFLSKNIKLFQLVINQAFKPLKLVMIHQIITSALVPIRAKILSMVTILNEKITDFKNKGETSNHDKSGRVLSHLIFELTSFDQRFRNNYKYNPFVENLDTVPLKKWMGLTADVLLQGDTERLGTTNWLNFESILANGRFKTEIIEDSNGLKVDTDYKINEEENRASLIKPTYSAFNLVKLFNNVTTHYNTMRMVKFQLKYVSTIQLRLIDNYHDYLRSRLKSFDDNYNVLNVLNIIPGSMDTANKQDVNDGMKGLEMLTGIFCSAQFVHSHLEQWSEELIFIQLWNAYKAVTHKKYEKETTIFDTNFGQYNSLIDDVRVRFNNFFKKGLRNYLKEYINTSQWDIRSVKDNSLHFAPLVSSLPGYLNYLQKNIVFSDYFAIANDLVTSICSLWYEYIVTNNKFTKQGTEQLHQDFTFLLNQLQHELLLVPHGDSGLYTTSQNYGYMKILQSIEVLRKYDTVIAKAMVKNFKSNQIRAEFEDELCNLTDQEVQELLYRIL